MFGRPGYLNRYLSCYDHRQRLLHMAIPFTGSHSVIFPYEVTSRTVFTKLHFQLRGWNREGSSPQPSRTSHKTCLIGFGVNGITTWKSVVIHVGLTSSASKVSTKTSNSPFSNGGKIIYLLSISENIVS